MTEFTWLQARQ